MSVPVHAEAAPEARHRLALNRLGLWMFIVSESFLFSAVIASRFYLLGSERPEELNQPLGLAISFVLLSSSFTAYRGETYAAFGDRRWLRWIAATMGLGLLFLVGVILEWEEGLRSFPPSTPYGSAFFSLIGLHAFHVLTGLVVLALVWRLGRRGRVGAANHWPIEAAVKYWHFVDVAWVFIFPTVYLVR